MTTHAAYLELCKQRVQNFYLQYLGQEATDVERQTAEFLQGLMDEYGDNGQALQLATTRALEIVGAFQGAIACWQEMSRRADQGGATDA